MLSFSKCILSLLYLFNPFLVGIFPSYAQKNLVPNGSFEENTGLPTEIGQFALAKSWQSFAPGTQPADYFNRAAKDRTSAPRNFIGQQEPKSGNAYGGQILYLNSKAPYTEFIQVPLSEPLQAGEEYLAAFYISLAEDSEFAVDGIGMHFSNRPPLILQGGYAQLKPQVRNPAKNIITDKQNWIKIEGTFKAIGGERFLTIGNFIPRQANAIKKVKTDREKKEPYKYAYYYLDDVSVKPIKEQPASLSGYFGNLETEKATVLRNIHFALDKATLLPESLPELDSLVQLLQTNPEWNILLEGHTDNTHTPNYNKLLSEDRAKSVKNYLISQGIPGHRLQTTGFGSSQPLADNTSETGRKQNRRVQFRIIK